MNIIFLDVDDVICTRKMYWSGFAEHFVGDGCYKSETGWMQDFDPVSCWLILRACQKIDDVRIVLSSSWGIHEYNEFVEKLKLYCPKLIGYLMTDSGNSEHKINHDKERFTNILEWLEQFRERYQVKNIAIIDDECGMINRALCNGSITLSNHEYFEYETKCVQIDDPDNGFGCKEYVKLLEIFGITV